MGVGGQRHAPAALPPAKRPGSHCMGGWVGPRAGLDGCGNTHTYIKYDNTNMLLQFVIYIQLSEIGKRVVKPLTSSVKTQAKV